MLRHKSFENSRFEVPGAVESSVSRLLQFSNCDLVICWGGQRCQWCALYAFSDARSWWWVEEVQHVHLCLNLELLRMQGRCTVFTVLFIWDPSNLCLVLYAATHPSAKQCYLSSVHLVTSCNVCSGSRFLREILWYSTVVKHCNDVYLMLSVYNRHRP